MRHKIVLPISLAFLLVACQSTLPLASSHSSETSENGSSSVSSISSFSVPSSVNHTIVLNKEVTTLTVGETLQLSWTLEPNDGSALLFSSSNEDILTVSSTGFVTAHAKGEAVISVALASDSSVYDSLALTVQAAPLQISDFQAKLATLREQEKSSAVSGHIVYQQNNASSTRDFVAYTNSLQIADSDGSKTLFTKVGFDLTALSLTATSVSETVLGTIGSDTTEEIVDNAIHLCPWGSLYGISGVLGDTLTSASFAPGEEAKANLVLEAKEENDHIVYRAETRFLNSTNALQVNTIAFTEKDGALTSGSYRFLTYEEGFDETSLTLEENTSPSSQEIFEGSLTYGERVESDEARLNRSNYLIQSYEIDTSTWRKGEAKLYVGDKVPLSMTNVLPAIHLKDVLSLTDDGISNPSIIASEKTGDITYLTALKAGTATITTTTYYGKTKQLTITVSEVPPQGIEINPNAITDLTIGQTAIYKVTLYPIGLSDATFNASFTDSAMAELAELTLDAENSYFQLKALKAGTVTVKVAATLDPSVTDEITVTILNPSTISVEKKIASLEVGSSASYSVKIDSSVFSDKSFTAAFQDSAMAEFANLTLDASASSFTLEALKEGSVTVIVTSVADPTLTDQITVTITPKATVEPIDVLHQAMIGKTYSGKYGTSTTITFTFEEATGTASFSNGNAYTFSYTLGTYGATSTKINFANVALTSESENTKAYFDGKTTNARNYPLIVLNDAKSIKLVVKHKSSTGIIGGTYVIFTVNE